jgi:hypothetical protein
VNTTAWIALAGAAVFAVADWVAKARRNQILEYVAKPATLVALIIVAVAIEPASASRRDWSSPRWSRRSPATSC